MSAEVASVVTHRRQELRCEPLLRLLDGELGGFLRFLVRGESAVPVGELGPALLPDEADVVEPAPCGEDVTPGLVEP